MPIQNRGFITTDGRYYEAPFPLAPNHRETAPPYPQGVGQAESDTGHSANHSTFNQRNQDMENAQGYQHYAHQMPAASPPPPIPGVNSPYTINQDSQFNFKLKDVIIIAGAIASAAVSWNNADGRLTRLEERVSTDIVRKIESIERKQDETIKSQAESIKSISAQIAELERAIVTKK